MTTPERLTFAESRWPGDPYPEALEAFEQSAKRESDAWAAVAHEAQREASAARSVRIRYTQGRNLPTLIASAQALVEPTVALHRLARRAEDARPPSSAHSVSAPSAHKPEEGTDV